MALGPIGLAWCSPIGSAVTQACSHRAPTRLRDRVGAPTWQPHISQSRRCSVCCEALWALDRRGLQLAAEGQSTARRTEPMRELVSCQSRSAKLTHVNTASFWPARSAAGDRASNRSITVPSRSMVDLRSSLSTRHPDSPRTGASDSGFQRIAPALTPSAWTREFRTRRVARMNGSRPTSHRGP